ncbi:MAG: hypothetical protein HQ446_02195 [Polaromonas sp.]|nr:hypothetical protein [Polaromonas sp.]
MRDVVMRKSLANTLARWGLCACLLVCFAVQAQTDDNQDAALTPIKPEPEYGGVVTREILTTMGQNFHSKFTEIWQTKENFEKFNILVKERPFRRGGTEILVIYTEVVVYRRQLPRDFLTLSRISQEAVEVTVKKVSEMDLESSLFKDVDLADSGI